MENPREDASGAVPDRRICRKPYRNVSLPAQDTKICFCVRAANYAFSSDNCDMDGEDSSVNRYSVTASAAVDGNDWIGGIIL